METSGEDLSDCLSSGTGTGTNRSDFGTNFQTHSFSNAAHTQPHSSNSQTNPKILHQNSSSLNAAAEYTSF